MTPKQLAEHFGVTRRTVYNWNEKGCPFEVVDDGTLVGKIKYDLDKVIEWRKTQWNK